MRSAQFNPVAQVCLIVENSWLAFFKAKKNKIGENPHHIFDFFKNFEGMPVVKTNPGAQLSLSSENDMIQVRP